MKTATAVGLDWRAHRVNAVPKPCRICGGLALMTDAKGRACHKTCAEGEAARQAEEYGQDAGGAS